MKLRMNSPFDIIPITDKGKPDLKSTSRKEVADGPL